ncbi:MAG: AraC family transcriptional regulator [Planctomycetota bacterium]
MPSPSYTMLHFAWFRILNEIKDWPTPFYVGRGVAHHKGYHSSTKVQPPLKRHFVLKVSLGQGGVYGDKSRTVAMNPGDAVLREFGNTEVWDHNNPDHTDDWEFIGLIFHGRSALTTCRALCNRYGHLLRLPLEGTAVRNLLALSDQPTQRIDMPATAGVKLVIDLLMAMAREAERAHLEPRSDRLIHKITDYIIANMTEDYSVAQLAQAHDVSREHLTRVFKQSLGQSPHEFITHARIQEACRLLSYTGLPTKAIASRVGFQSMSTFFRAFRQVLESTPTQYRRSAKPADRQHFTDGLAEG